MGIFTEHCVNNVQKNLIIYIYIRPFLQMTKFVQFFVLINEITHKLRKIIKRRKSQMIKF
jgi:hypothetical protein